MYPLWHEAGYAYVAIVRMYTNLLNAALGAIFIWGLRIRVVKLFDGHLKFQFKMNYSILLSKLKMKKQISKIDDECVKII